MANTQSQFGFKHIGFLSGGAPDYQLATAAIQSTYATKLYFGDPVCYSTGTNYLIAATSSTSNTGTAIVGIFQGCTYVPSTGGAPVWSPWWPAAANADATAYIVNAPNAKFLVAALNTQIPVTAIGRNIGFSTGAGGTTSGGGFSTYVVDQATINTTLAIGYFRLLGMYQGVGNGSDTTTAYNWVVVGFNPLCTAVIG
jgi:hypothetical protein